MSKTSKRRTWSSSEKLRIVLAGMEPGVEVSELCRREGVGPTQYYNWKSQLVKSADAVFGQPRASKSDQQELDRRTQDLTRMRAVIAEITAENLELKKTRLD